MKEFKFSVVKTMSINIITYAIRKLLKVTMDIIIVAHDYNKKISQHISLIPNIVKINSFVNVPKYLS